MHGEDLSGLGLNRWRPPVPGAGDTKQARQSAVASLAIAAVTGGTGSAHGQVQVVDGLPQTSSASPHLIVTAAAERLLAHETDVLESLVPGLSAAILLAQAGTHFWHGREMEPCKPLQRERRILHLTRPRPHHLPWVRRRIGSRRQLMGDPRFPVSLPHLS